MSYDSRPGQSKPLGYAVVFLYSFVIALFWIPAFVVRRVSRALTEIGVDSWPRTNGSITGSNVRVVHGCVVDYALGRLEYSYRVAGEYYAGSITRQYPDEQAAWDFVDARQDKAVVVRYKDDQAHSSALRDDDQDPSWNDAGGPGFLSMVWNHWRDELRTEEPTAPDDEDLELDEEGNLASADAESGEQPAASR